MSFFINLIGVNGLSTQIPNYNLTSLPEVTPILSSINRVVPTLSKNVGNKFSQFLIIFAPTGNIKSHFLDEEKPNMNTGECMMNINSNG